MVVLLEVSSISTEEIWSSVRVTIEFFPDQDPCSPIARQPALGRELVVQNFFHLNMMESIVFLGTINAADIFWYSSPDLCVDTVLS